MENKIGKLRHLISINDLNLQTINDIINTAISFKESPPKKLLKNKIISTIFFENSTRTLSSFEIAIKRLGGEVVRLEVMSSSTKKGETIADTAANIDAMKPNAIVIRHKGAGAGNYLAKFVHCPIINGGDGAHAHPTQSLLDAMTLKLHFGEIEGLKIAIVGDITNSRVANSNAILFDRLGAEVTLVSPPHFQNPLIRRFRNTTDLRDVLDEISCIISLRTQTERHSRGHYGDLRDYASRYCITKELIGERNIVVMHPGPVHRNIDIDDYMLEDKKSLVLEQVQNGVFLRMAVLSKFHN